MGRPCRVLTRWSACSVTHQRESTGCDGWWVNRANRDLAAIQGECRLRLSPVPGFRTGPVIAFCEHVVCCRGCINPIRI